jgi:hypothetical protein
MADSQNNQFKTKRKELYYTFGIDNSTIFSEDELLITKTSTDSTEITINNITIKKNSITKSKYLDVYFNTPIELKNSFKNNLELLALKLSKPFSKKKDEITKKIIKYQDNITPIQGRKAYLIKKEETEYLGKVI